MLKKCEECKEEGHFPNHDGIDWESCENRLGEVNFNTDHENEV